ncbi:GGDEF domain protein [Sesbania bispinosa]|nr:GGDEF domain protein [Sesbania bispinosa]
MSRVLPKERYIINRHFSTIPGLANIQDMRRFEYNSYSKKNTKVVGLCRLVVPEHSRHINYGASHDIGATVLDQLLAWLAPTLFRAKSQ